MKTRIKNKKRKQEIKKLVLDPINKSGINIDYTKFGSGYFIFNFGKNSVCHFRIKELPYVLFGIWNVSNKIKVFADDYVNMNKFKPSQCKNFTVNEVIEMITKYKNNQITLQDIIVKYLGYDYDDYLWVQPIDIETGNDVYSQKVKMTPKQFEKYYVSKYEEQMFRDKHSGLNPEEVETAELNIKTFVNELCESDYIDSVYVHRKLPFFREWASIEIMYSDKCYELTDEEFNNLDKYWYEKITGRNGDNWIDTFINFNDSAIVENGTLKFAHNLINNEKYGNWKIYKENGKRVC